MYKIETERGDLFDVNMMISMQITVNGQASEQELAAAFKEAVGAFEILNCKVVIDGNGDAFYDSCDGSANSITFGKFELAELIKEQERLRFRLEDGEFLRCFVSLAEPEGMKICFLMHHLGGDGKSLCYFIEAFLKALNGEKPEYRKAVFLTRETLPQDVKMSFLASLIVKTYNRRWRKERRVFGFEDMNAAYEKFWETHRSVVRNEVTGSDALNEKLSECKANGIGFTSYTIAEMICGSHSVQDVGLAVDGRLDGNRTMSNQATGISVKYRYDAGKTLAGNAAVIDGMMKSKLRDNSSRYLVLRFMSEFDPTLVDAVNLEFAGYFHSRTTAKLARLLGYGENTKDLSITNLTRLDIPTTYGKYELTDLVFVPPVVSYGKNIVGMVTVDGHLNTAFHTL
ncbi:MAG: hypothetical protein IK093_18570 [Ruminiclostridium sp.]|nr:hypothetical protein [Ruminiclostridium sp.]